VLLSAALIVRNEERFLGACLSSIKDLVDEAVVVDTGSTDRSREIAIEHGARVEEFAWTADFSAARNRALDLARGGWILYIDADETVRAGLFREVRAQLTEPERVGYYVNLYPRPACTPYRVLRLFRNDPRIRFRGIIHENVWPSILEQGWGTMVGVAPLTLDHFGYEGDQRHKHARNLPLLHKSLRQDPTRVFAWCHLADIYLALGKPRRAEWAWCKALDLVRSRTTTAQDDHLPYSRLIESMIERGDNSDNLLREALDRFPSNAWLWWLHGRAMAGQKEFSKAISSFERVLAFGKAGDFDPYVAYDARLFGALAYEALGGCCFRLGAFGESRRYYELAAACDPERLEYRTKRALCARLEHSGAPPPARESR